MVDWAAGTDDVISTSWRGPPVLTYLERMTRPHASHAGHNNVPRWQHQLLECSAPLSCLKGSREEDIHKPIAIRLEAIAGRVEAITSRVEDIYKLGMTSVWSGGLSLTLVTELAIFIYQVLTPVL